MKTTKRRSRGGSTRAKSTRKIALIPDIHAPRQSEAALELCITALKGWKPDVVIQLGDLIDLASVSTYAKHPAHTMSLEEEIEGARDVVRRLTGIGAKKNVITLGNHSARASKFLVDKAPEFLPYFDLEQLLGFRELGWTVVPYKSSYQIGKLRVTHDVGRAGVNAARQSVVDVGDNIAFGHTHRIQVHYQGSVSGGQHVGATLGWLGDPEHIDYRHRDMVKRDWMAGFGVVHMLPDGTFWLQAIPIVDGRCVVDGEVYGV